MIAAQDPSGTHSDTRLMANDSNTVLFANPSAQSGKASELIDRARELLRRAGVAHDFAPTSPDGKTVEWVKAAIDHHQARTVIYLGGDGTFADVAKGIIAADLAANVSLGMLPSGTANDQGKSFGIEAGAENLADNVRVIAEGFIEQMDVARLERLGDDDQALDVDLFFDLVSIGFSAAVLRRRNQDRRAVDRSPISEIYRDQLVYLGAAVKELFESYVDDVKFTLDAELDGKRMRFDSLLDVIIKNTRVYGGEWILAPNARSDDGLVEMVPISGRRDFTSKLLSNLRHGLFNDDDLRGIGIEHSQPVAAKEMLLRFTPIGDPTVKTFS